MKQVREVQPDSGTFHLEIPPQQPAFAGGDAPPSEKSHHLLRVEYHTKQPAALEWSQDFALPVPAFPGEVWIDKTIWEVTLPVDQHLFTLPDGVYAGVFLDPAGRVLAANAEPIRRGFGQMAGSSRLRRKPTPSPLRETPIGSAILASPPRLRFLR